MTGHSPPRSARTPTDRTAVQIGVARALAQSGRGAAARRLCGALFLDRLAPIAGDPALLQAFTECLLLLEMSTLLPRLLRAVFGVELEMRRPGGAGSSRWTLALSNGVTLLIPAGGAPAGSADDARTALWAGRILQAAAEEAAPAAAAAVRSAVLA